MNEKKLRKQAREILRQAGQRGGSNNFFFTTTFERYRVQMQIMSQLEKDIKEHGMTVTKEYVKGRENLVANPAIGEYNKTATAANGTVSTLINILKSFTDDEKQDSKIDQLLKAINDG